MSGIFYPQARVTLQVVFESFGELERPKIFPVQPRSLTVYSNNYHEADTWGLEFDAKDLPFAPNLIKSGAAEIYVYQTRGVGDNAALTNKRLDPRLRLGRFKTDPAVAADASVKQDGSLEPTITGLFDNVEVNYSEDGRAVSIDGRDYTALFLDKEWPQRRVKTKSGKGEGKLVGKSVRPGKRLDKTLEDLIQAVDLGGNMNLRVEPPELVDELPTVGRSEGRAHKRGIPVANGASFWEVMIQLATRYGFIVFVRNLDVVLTTPQTFIAGKTEARKVAWGRNLSSLNMRRKIGKERVPTIEVRSYNEKKRRVIKATFPAKGQTASIGLGTERDQIRRFTVPNVTDQKQLKNIAESAYNMLARAEMTVQIETKDLLDLEGNDLIELRAGDALGIKFDPFNNELLESMNVAERAQYLVNRGFTPQVAQTIAQHFGQLDSFREPFRVREATLDWSHEDGLSVHAEVIQFINVPLSDAEGANVKIRDRLLRAQRGGV